MASELRDLADFLCSLKIEDVPENVQKAGRLCLLDSISSAIGAFNNSQVNKVDKAYLKICGDNGKVKLWGRDKYAPVLTAIFLNAIMGHTLEMDDVHTGSKTHIGAVVIPAAWGLADYLGSSGKELLLAVICGYEAMSRIGMALGVSSHRNHGWHVTGTSGTFGAAAACAKLLHLSVDQTVSAFGMAGTQSCGLWAFLADGASCKVLHPARAAVSGCEAALLAQAGMTGPESILTASDGGLLKAMSDAYDVSCVNRDLGTTWEILRLDKKPYPCCRSTHCAIDGALALRANGLNPDKVKHIVVETYLVGNKQCGMSEGSRKPRNPVDAKFSTPFTVACALLFGKVTTHQFEQKNILDEKVQKLLSKVTVVSDEEFTKVYPKHWGCRITATCEDGRVMTETVNDASGSVDNPLSEKQVEDKAIALLQGAFGEKASEIASKILATPDSMQLPEI